ncbi:hypothetical protein [Megalodesulfovibrio paquesii]
MLRRLGEWLRRTFDAVLDRRQLERELTPESFQALARELRELAGMSSALWPRQHTFQERIKRIMDEMEQLDRLVSTPQFRRLSPQKRLELKKSLIQSRDQLMETVQNAPAPTSTLQ